MTFAGCNLKTGDPTTPGTAPGHNSTGGTSVDESGDTTEGQSAEQDTTVSDGGQASETQQQTGQNSQTGQNGQGGPGKSIEARVEKMLDSMSMAEKIGQMFVVGFDGTEPGADLKEMIKNRYVGGVILFQRNVKDPGQLLGLNNSIKEINKSNKAPLLISVDEEGGRVSRMPDRFRDMPEALSVGNTKNSGYAYDIGGILAGETAAFGFNTDFAPVLDIWSNPKNTVIGDRAFGKDPETVSGMGIQVMNGIRDGGIIPVVKHFPGHGDTVTDSHVGLPKVDYGMDRLESFELVPFKNAIAEGAEAVMVAHILMSALDNKYPASLSKAVITDLLRDKMGFDGVVITDDMTMGAIAENYSIGKAAVRSVLAGADIILVCHGTESQKLAMDSVEAAVKNGTIPAARIDESVGRILRLKYKFELSDRTIKSVNVEELNKKIEAVLTE